jgi:Dolichyl-phosphate-mannose-protein mannosyltransferase
MCGVDRHARWTQRLFPFHRVIKIGVSAPAERRASDFRGRTRDYDRMAGLRVPFLVFAVSRVAFALLGRVSPGLLGPSSINRPVLPSHDLLAHAWTWTAPWFRFDATWYVGIAQHGYHWGTLGSANTNFLPLYPLLIRAFQPLTLGSPWLAAWLISNVATLVATILLWRWAANKWDPGVALGAVLLMTVFPFSFFLVTPYTESLFLALALAAFVFAEQDRWAAATLMAGLSTITRPVGIAVVVGLVVMALSRRNPRAALVALLGSVPILSFAVYLGVTLDQPLGFLAYHSSGWIPAHGGAWTTFVSQFHTALSPWDRVDAFLAFLFLISIPVVWTRVGASYAAFSLVALALPLVHGLVSMERYVTVVFPVITSWSLWRLRWLQFALFAVSLLGLFLATTLFLTGASIF